MLAGDQRAEGAEYLSSRISPVRYLYWAGSLCFLKAQIFCVLGTMLRHVLFLSSGVNGAFSLPGALVSPPTYSSMVSAYIFLNFFIITSHLFSVWTGTLASFSLGHPHSVAHGYGLLFSLLIIVSKSLCLSPGFHCLSLQIST